MRRNSRPVEMASCAETLLFYIATGWNLKNWLQHDMEHVEIVSSQTTCVLELKFLAHV